MKKLLHYPLEDRVLFVLNEIVIDFSRLRHIINKERLRANNFTTPFPLHNVTDHMSTLDLQTGHLGSGLKLIQ